MSAPLLCSVYLINDGLHVTLVFVVPIEQGRPLLRADPQSSLHGHADDLTIMFTPQALIGTELRGGQEGLPQGHTRVGTMTHLFLELHQR